MVAGGGGGDGVPGTDINQFNKMGSYTNMSRTNAILMETANIAPVYEYCTQRRQKMSKTAQVAS